MDITNRTFAFPESKGIPLYYVSAATGSNVVKVQKILIFNISLLHYLFTSYTII